LLIGPVYTASEVKGMPLVLTEVAEQLRARGWQVDSHVQAAPDRSSNTDSAIDPLAAAWVGTAPPPRSSMLDRHPRLFAFWNAAMPVGLRRTMSLALRPTAYLESLSHNLRVGEDLLDTARGYDVVLLSLDEAAPGLGALFATALPSVAIISLYNLADELRPGFNRWLRWIARVRLGRGAHPFLFRSIPPARVRLALFGSRLWSDQAVQAGLPPERARVIYFGVPLPAPVPRPARAGRRVLLVGRLAPDKGAHVLLRALPRVRSAMPDVTITIIAGPGPAGYRRQLQEIIATNHLDDAVTIAPAVSRSALSSAYAAHDALFFYSAYADPVALVLMEAYAAGIPVAASQARPNAALVRDGHTCVCYDPADQRSVAEALISLLGDPRLGHRLAAQAQQLVRESFSLDAMGETYDTTLRQFIAAERTRPG
jgi:glycosyltransferase involved in cell wall biosynthesis